MCEVYPRVINTLLPLERPEKSWFRFSTLVSPPYHTFWPYWWKIILVKCKALEIILAGSFMADDVESFIIFPCSWYNFATNLLFVFVCFLLIFKEFNTMECKKQDWDIRFKENSHERGKKRLYSVESKILRYFFLVLVFNNWWIPFSIPLTLSRISCLVYLISILSKSTRNEEKTSILKLVPPCQSKFCYTCACWNFSRLCVHSLSRNLICVHLCENLAMSSLHALFL